MKTNYSSPTTAWVVLILVALVAIMSCVFMWPSSSLSDASMDDLVQLPIPSWNGHTAEEIEKMKDEIYDLKPSKRIRDWVNPEFGAGFCVHITEEDQIEVSHFSKQLESDKERVVRDHLESLTGDRYFENSDRHHRNISLADLELMVILATTCNEPAFLVVTSERKVATSKVLPQVLDRLFIPTVKLHYVAAK